MHSANERGGAGIWTQHPLEATTPNSRLPSRERAASTSVGQTGMVSAQPKHLAVSSTPLSKFLVKKDILTPKKVNFFLLMTFFTV